MSEAMQTVDIPRLAIMIGDPGGVGPEVVVKALAQADVRASAHQLLVGSGEAVRRACETSGVALGVREIGRTEDARFEPGVLDVLDTGLLSPADFRFGAPSAAAGKAVAGWMDACRQLVSDGWAAGWVVAPIDRTSLKLGAGVAETGEALEDETPLFRVSGALRLVPMSEHIAISAVPASITRQAIVDRLSLVQRELRRWGIARPRFGVAGLNPHARGVEENREILPAVEAARAAGIDVTGPVSPDAVFRQCIEGRYDVVLSMYHDQGQIALKTAAFEGACSFYLGLPFVQATVPHGSAHDIAGRGIADARSMANAIRGAGLQASGRYSLQ